MALHNGVQGFYITARDIRRKDHIMRKTTKTKDVVAEEMEQEMAKQKQDEYYDGLDEGDNAVEAVSAPDICLNIWNCQIHIKNMICKRLF